MAFTNNVMIVRHRLLAMMVAKWKEDKLCSDIDRLPIDLSPRRTEVLGRCCVHKERAVWKYKMFPLLGYDMSDEKDELTPLSDYARRAIAGDRELKENIMCVVDEACSSCVKANYEITNLCRGCVARSCSMNCPKGAISHNVKQHGQAVIDHSLCINCGKCYQSCPYHAIVYVPVPCEEACPVKAISKDQYGVEHIDESKCIYCGKCLNACPFGAIFEISQVFDVLNNIWDGKKVVAMVAPAILGQFKTSKEKLFGAIKAIGFDAVVEVAEGAMVTTSTEAEELKEKLAEGQPFMTTSCCPSYIELVRKHIPEMAPYVSSTGSPMYYTSQIVKQKYPDAKQVFIGPCIAKRKEARNNPLVDYVMTFEELGSVLTGYDIDFDTVTPYVPDVMSVKEAHGFAQTGGVAESVRAYLDQDVNYLKIAGMDKKTIALVKSYAKTKKAPAKFLEMMVCPNGCISGPCTYNDSVSGKTQLNAELGKIEDTYASRRAAAEDK